MIICIEFDDSNKDEVAKTKNLFFGSPNGTALASNRARCVYPEDIGQQPSKDRIFWYLDKVVLDTHYGGVYGALSSLVQYPGVKSVSIHQHDL